MTEKQINQERKNMKKKKKISLAGLLVENVVSDVLKECLAGKTKSYIKAKRK
jgi:hypothetical protein